MSKSKKQNISHRSDAESVIAKDRIFYWAYGSNLCIRQMQRRCPKAIKYGPMIVKDCALIFRLYADVTVREGVSTPGGLWQITTECERELDRYEGVANGNYMKRYFRITIKGKKYTCLFYQMRASKGVMPPTEQYIDTIADGYMDFGLDLEILDAALQESWGNKKLTERLLDRHERRGSPRLARDIIALTRSRKLDRLKEDMAELEARAAEGSRS